MVSRATSATSSAARGTNLKLRFLESNFFCARSGLRDSGGSISDYAEMLSMSSRARR